MLIDDNAQILKNAFDYKVMSINRIDCILKDYRNNKNDIRSNIEHRIYKRFYNKLISLE